jgi:hypothetical protein
MSNYNKSYQNNQYSQTSSRKPTWITATKNGFNVWKTQIVIPEIIGTIEEVDWKLEKWENGKFIESIPSPKGCSIPEGYKRTVVLKVRMPSGDEYQINLTTPQTRSYQEFKSQLKAAGKDLRTITTKMKPYRSAYQGKTFTDITFQEV